MSMNISRRSFMKGAAAASLAVAASTMLTGCDLPKFDFGGIFGNRSKTITVADGKTINIALTDYKIDSICNEYLPEFKVVNNTDYALYVDKAAHYGAYTLIPTLKYNGISGDPTSILWGKSTLDEKVIAKTENNTGNLVLDMSKVSNWNGIELTLTAVDGNGDKVGEPAVFTFEK